MIAPIKSPSPNHDAREGAIDAVILHYTGMESGEAALYRLRDPASRVSCHYLIEEDGRVFSLVPEARRAWHAGVSRWGARDGLNDCSIGIEIVNPGHEWGYRAFPDAQIISLLALLREIVARHDIRPERVLGHSDIAPTRKDDPGELFDWRGLAQIGLSVWHPTADDPELGRPLDPEGIAALARAMEIIGYDMRAMGAALTAFRRRFRPKALEGPPVMRDFLIAKAIAASHPVLDRIRPLA